MQRLMDEDIARRDLQTKGMEEAFKGLRQLAEERKERMKYNGVLKERLQTLNKPTLQKMFTENIEYLENIWSGKIESWRHKAYHKDALSQQELLYKGIDNPFSDDQVMWTFEEMKNQWMKSMNEFYRKSAYINKVLLPECLIKFYSDFFHISKEESEIRIGESPADDDDDSF